MKGITLVLAALAIGGWASAAYERQSVLDLGRGNADLTTRLASKASAQLAQEKRDCTVRGENYFRKIGHSEDNSKSDPSKFETHSFSIHYNANLDRCLVLTTDQIAADSIAKEIVDAGERRAFGEYLWFPSKTKKYWEQKPFMCKFTDKDGTDSFCSSTAEWDSRENELMTG